MEKNGIIIIISPEIDRYVKYKSSIPIFKLKLKFKRITISTIILFKEVKI